MSNYDFQTLSFDEFEHLVRDLLQKFWNVHLESFKAGRDGGIDLRYTTVVNLPGTIVQCKRYAANAFSRLYGELINSELAKVNALKPARYVIATSVALSPDNKAKILEKFSPYCHGPQDIFGRDDINSLLGRYPDIEQQNVKLWLSGVPMLERLLNAGIFNLTAATIDSVRSELARIVIHDGINDARLMLQKHHHVVLVGLPGIGKTTVAQILLAERVHEGDEPVCVTGDINEAMALLTKPMNDPNHRLVIHYDDFLGQTSLEAKFNKNEEQRLSRLIETVKTMPNVRLIMTTRDYILEQAKRTHEHLSRAEPEWAKCSVRLEHYDQGRRAKILYQHLYFSDMPNSRLNALLKANTHKAIIRHPNFNPRIISALCKRVVTDSISDAEFVTSVLDKLDQPDEVWKHPFEQQLDRATQLMLLALVTFPGARAHKADLELACKAAANSFGVSWDGISMEKTLKLSEGTFTILKQVDDGWGGRPEPIVTLHNPSIRDFLLGWLSGTPDTVRRLYQNVGVFQQALGILGEVGHDQQALFEMALDELGEGIIQAPWRLLSVKSHLIYAKNVKSDRDEAKRIWQLFDLIKFELKPLYLQYVRTWLIGPSSSAHIERLGREQWVLGLWNLFFEAVVEESVLEQKILDWMVEWISGSLADASSTSDIDMLLECWRAQSNKLEARLNPDTFFEEMNTAFGKALSTIGEVDIDAWEAAKSLHDTIQGEFWEPWQNWGDEIESGIERAQKLIALESDDHDEPSLWDRSIAVDIDELFSSVTEGRSQA